MRGECRWDVIFNYQFSTFKTVLVLKWLVKKCVRSLKVSVK